MQEGSTVNQEITVTQVILGHTILLSKFMAIAKRLFGLKILTKIQFNLQQK